MLDKKVVLKDILLVEEMFKQGEEEGLTALDELYNDVDCEYFVAVLIAVMSRGKDDDPGGFIKLTSIIKGLLDESK